MKHLHVVYALITDETREKVLMVKNKDNNQWTLPGGAVEAYETLEQAIIREAKEETGLDIKAYGLVSVNEAILLDSQEHAFFFTFRAEIIAGDEKISLPHEILAIQWVDVQEANKLMPYYKEGISGIVEKGVEITYFDEGRV